MAASSEPMRLDKQVIAISGAGGGLGRAMALDAATRGARVVVNDYGTSVSGDTGGNPSAAEATVAQIVQLGGEAVSCVSDVGTEAGAQQVIDSAIDRFGRIDGLVHAACVFPPHQAFEDFAREDFERVVRVSVHGAWGLCQAAWPRFKAQGHGRIVLVQSAAGFYGRSGMPAYSIAKSSFIGFTNYLAQEGKAHGILVNNVSPVGWSRAPASEGDHLDFMQQMMPAADLGPLVALLLHRAFDRTGLYLHSGGGVVTRIFVPETKGVAFPRDGFTPEAINERLDEILDEAGYRTPTSTDDVGAYLFQQIMTRDGAPTAV